MNIPFSKLKRIVIIGAGFAGLQIIKYINKYKFQIVIIDKNNYHTFQPLLYQVATASIEPDSILHTIRTIIKKKENFFFRLANINYIDTNNKKIISDIGEIYYDYLIIATGSKTNYFGNKRIEKYTMPMKSITEAISLRTSIFHNFELALFSKNSNEKQCFMNFVIVGGGPTGVELAGSLAELKNYTIPKDYPDLDIKKMNIYLIQATSRLLDGMCEKLSKIAFDNLNNMGVNIWLNTPVKDYDGKIIYTEKNTLESFNVIWVAGVKGALIRGINKNSQYKNRFLVNSYNNINSYKDIFAIGDVALMKDNNYPNGHPMTVQPAIQQGIHLALNLNRLISNKPMKPFKYKNMGSMAIIGRNKAVCDFPLLKISGFIAWIIWIFIHLINLMSFRKKIIVFINWIFEYFNYNKSLKIIIRSYIKNK